MGRSIECMPAECPREPSRRGPVGPPRPDGNGIRVRSASARPTSGLGASGAACIPVSALPMRGGPAGGPEGSGPRRAHRDPPRRGRLLEDWHPRRRRGDREGVWRLRRGDGAEARPRLRPSIALTSDVNQAQIASASNRCPIALGCMAMPPSATALSSSATMCAVPVGQAPRRSRNGTFAAFSCWAISSRSPSRRWQRAFGSGVVQSASPGVGMSKKSGLPPA